MQHNEHENGFLNFLIAPEMSTTKQIMIANSKRSMYILFNLTLAYLLREYYGILGGEEVFLNP